MINFDETLEKKYSVEELLRNGEAVSFHPLGTSMWPLFVKPEDSAVVFPLNNNPKRGDVIVYRRPEGPLVIHRVWKVHGNEIFYVGDHQTEIEGPASCENALGIMKEFIRCGKKYKVSNPIYVVYAKLWLLVRPFRWKIIEFGQKVKNYLN